MGNSVSSATINDPEVTARRAGNWATLPNRGRSTIDGTDDRSIYQHHTHCHSTLGGRGQKLQNDAKKADKGVGSTEPETSRMLFLLYLIHRTWNVVVDTMDPKSKRSRFNQMSDGSKTPRSQFGNHRMSNRFEINDDDCSSIYGSQQSTCSCSYCNVSTKNNPIFGQPEHRISISESEFSCSIDYRMAPSAGKTPPGTHIDRSKAMPNDVSQIESNGQHIKENQRPPVYNAEDYILSLKKYSRKTSGSLNGRSIYDTTDDFASEAEPTSIHALKDKRISTLPSKHSDYKSPIQSPPEAQYEMSLRQFGSITDLLTKLRADLRASFPSFVQEFVASPMNGVSLLLDVLRSIQLSQSNNTTGTNTLTPTQRNYQTYQRRALLDELACLQCLHVCTSRCIDAGVRLGTSSVGLLPLAASATGQGIRSRILALQLLTTACDRATFDGLAVGGVVPGHTSVSEALSTLRLRCGEPVRFRLLVGMLNSGGGSGELQTIGLKFINTFLNNTENCQARLYLQAELHQAGCDPANMDKTINESSPWLEKLRAEVKIFEENRINVEELIVQNREAERIRSQMVILERRVQILQEEKTVLTSMERRLQERCADLQRQVFRLQSSQNAETGFPTNLDIRPVALPRHVPPRNTAKTRASSEQDDEGISSSETGQSLSPEPILVLPMSNTQKYRITVTSEDTPIINKDDDDANAVSIDEVIEELANIVSEAERDFSTDEVLPAMHTGGTADEIAARMEKDIVPVNLLPQPPRKSRSLVHLLSHGESDFGGSDYGLLMRDKNDDVSGPVMGSLDPCSGPMFYEDHEYSQYKFVATQNQDHNFSLENPDILSQSRTNRDILNVIMDAREKDNDMNGFIDLTTCGPAGDVPDISKDIETAPQKFSGVFFMTQMSTPQKYPKPDITAALEARRVTKNLDRIESYGGGLDTMIDIVMTETANKQHISKHQQQSTQMGAQMLLTGSSMTRVPIQSTAFKPGVHRSPVPGGAGSSSKLTDLPSGLY